MNSQQELLDAINTISNGRDQSCDTPATVLRVDGDVVWVHIDGGADETPVQKTVNCQEGETVQVRISNGSAFLVGNASSPPTDDTVANVAHFVADQAEIKAVTAQNKAIAAEVMAEAAQAAVAQSLTTYETWYILSATEPTQPTEDSHSGWSTTEPAWSSSSTDTLYYSIRTVKGDGSITWSAVGTVQSYADLVILKNAVISTVASEYVGQGSSGVTSLSSTMYQNANGVNIYNNTLAAGDSYTHIDGDSLDIKTATTAGSIDDTNDPVVASFGADESFIRSSDSSGESKLLLSSTEFKITKETQNDSSGWVIDENSIHTTGFVDNYTIFLDKSIPEIYVGPANTGQSHETVAIYNSGIQIDNHGSNWEDRTSIQPDQIILRDTLSGDYKYVFLRNGQIELTGDVYGLVTSGGYTYPGYKKTPTVLTSTTISASTTSYTFTDDEITADSVIDIYDTIFNFNATNAVAVNGSCTVTFPAQSSSHTMKLFVY